MSILPQKLQRGITLRRIKKLLRGPALLVNNFKFWWNDDISKEQHIFVVGPPRSGTTLIKNVLRAHDEICSVDGETYFFFRRNYAAFRHDSVSDEQMKALISKAQSDIGLFDQFAERNRKKSGSSFFLEKTPEHALRMRYLIEHYPESLFIFVVRDPRDGFRSAKNNPRYWRTLPDADPLQAYIETWRKSIEAYNTHSNSGQVYLLQYEAFCHEPERELRQVNRFLELDTQSHQLHPGSYGRTPLGALKGQKRLRKPITAESVGKWKQELNRNEIRAIEDQVEIEMQELGYPLSSEL